MSECKQEQDVCSYSRKFQISELRITYCVHPRAEKLNTAMCWGQKKLANENLENSVGKCPLGVRDCQPEGSLVWMLAAGTVLLTTAVWCSSRCVWLSRCNNKVYRIDDIDFNARPTDTFQMRDGSHISYVEYYRKVSSPRHFLRLVPALRFRSSVAVAPCYVSKVLRNYVHP